MCNILKGTTEKIEIRNHHGYIFKPLFLFIPRASLAKALTAVLTKKCNCTRWENFRARRSNYRNSWEGRFIRGRGQDRRKTFPFTESSNVRKRKTSRHNVAVYHNWASQCIIQGKLVDAEGYEAHLVYMLPFLFKCNNIDNFSLYNAVYDVDQKRKENRKIRIPFLKSVCSYNTDSQINYHKS